MQADQLNQEEDDKQREEFEKEAEEKPWLRFAQYVNLLPLACM
jgi:hypothetical protein